MTTNEDNERWRNGPLRPAKPKPASSGKPFNERVCYKRETAKLNLTLTHGVLFPPEDLKYRSDEYYLH